MSRKEYFKTINDVTGVLVDVEEEMYDTLFTEILYTPPNIGSYYITYYNLDDVIFRCGITCNTLQYQIYCFESFKIMYELTSRELSEFLRKSVRLKNISQNIDE